MRIRIPDKASDLKIKGKAFLLILAGAVLLAFFSAVALAPAAKFREYQELVNADSLFTLDFVSQSYDPEMQWLIRERAYKESLLELSESDSIQLVINLEDSTAALSIRGVVIHRIRISEFSRDRFLEKLPLVQEIKLLSQPLAVVSQYATIVKEPVVIRQAPRDTLEAALTAWEPDTLVQNPAFASLLTGKGLQIILEQDINAHFRDHWGKFRFYNHLRTRKALTAAKDFLRFSRQQYQPTITIKLPVDDLRAIYRALPDSTLIALKL